MAGLRSETTSSARGIAGLRFVARSAALPPRDGRACQQGVETASRFETTTSRRSRERIARLAASARFYRRRREKSGFPGPNIAMINGRNL